MATGFVDHPVAAHKSHRDPTPYLGGIGLIVAVLVGLPFTDRLTPQVAVIALGGSFIGGLGLLDDYRSIGALFRFTIEFGVAGVAVAAGLRIHATDIPAIDALLTLVWIVGVTNAVNLLDNTDGLAAGVSAAAATAVFTLGVLGEQIATATVAAGLAGGCVWGRCPSPGRDGGGRRRTGAGAPAAGAPTGSRRTAGRGVVTAPVKVYDEPVAGLPRGCACSWRRRAWRASCSSPRPPSSRWSGPPG